MAGAQKMELAELRRALEIEDKEPPVKRKTLMI